MKFRILFCLLICLLYGCSSRNKKGDSNPALENDQIKVIDLDSAIANPREVYLSEFADSISFIKLETKKESLLGFGIIHVYDEYIIASRKIFDWKGNFVTEIGRQGRGPGEDPAFPIVKYLNKYFYAMGLNFVRYDSSGVFKGDHWSFNTPENSGYIFYDFAAVENGFVFYNYPDSIQWVNNNFELQNGGKRIIKKGPYLKGIGHYSGMLTRSFTSVNNKISFFNFMNDTIFEIDKNSAQPKYVLYYPENKLPEKFYLYTEQSWILNVPNYVRNGTIRSLGIWNESDGKQQVTEYCESNNYYFFSYQDVYFFRELRNKPEPSKHIAIYNKKTGLTTTTKTFGFIDDLLDYKLFNPVPANIANEKMVMPVYPYEILAYVAEKQTKEEPVNPKLLALSKEIHENDNLILFVAHMKNK